MGDGKMSVRAGYALTFDAPQFGTIHSPGGGPGSFTNPDLGVFSLSLNGGPSVSGRMIRARRASTRNNSSAGGDYVCAQPGVALFGSSPTGAPPFNAFGVTQDLKAPKYHYFHATVQREIGGRNAITLAYVGSRGQDLMWVRDINSPPVGSALTSPDLLRPLLRAVPDAAHIYILNNDSKSWYDSLQLSFRQNAWHGINTAYNYTLGKCEDYNSGNRDSADRRRRIPTIRQTTEGPCGSDVLHNFNLAGTYAIPETTAMGDLTRGWSIGMVFTALSGRPFTPGISTLDNSGQATVGWAARELHRRSDLRLHEPGRVHLEPADARRSGGSSDPTLLLSRPRTARSATVPAMATVARGWRSST